MKKYLLLLLITVLSFSCDKKKQLPPNTYQINVSAPGVLNGIRAYIKIIDNRRQEINIDTAMVVNEKFSFSGKVNNAAIRILTVNSVKGSLAFILEPGELNISLYKDSLQNSKVEGTRNNVAFNTYKQNYRNLNNRVSNLRIERNEAKLNSDPKVLENKDIEFKKARKKQIDYPHNFIDANTDLDISLLILESQLIGANQNIKYLKRNMENLNEVINKNTGNKFIGQKVNTFIALKEREESISIGRKAPDFTSVDTNGKLVSLEAIKGKVTIIDFWAAWCGPCRRENPNIVRIYEKYHDKGLEIIGVSLDGRNNQSNPKQQWVKAIENDNLTWHQVSSLMYFRDPVAELYNINSIPATFVLNEDGIILAKKLRGKALENKISELLD